MGNKLLFFGKQTPAFNFEKVNNADSWEISEDTRRELDEIDMNIGLAARNVNGFVFGPTPRIKDK